MIFTIKHRFCEKVSFEIKLQHHACGKYVHGLEFVLHLSSCGIGVSIGRYTIHIGYVLYRTNNILHAHESYNTEMHIIGIGCIRLHIDIKHVD